MIQSKVFNKTNFILALLTGLVLFPNYSTAQRRVVKVEKNVVVAPRRGVTVATVPTRSRVIVHSNVSYHFYGGIFYKPVGGRYVVVAPPVGIRIAMLPAGHTVTVVSGRRYFYYYGTFYVKAGDQYEVVQAPVGALVESIPEGADELEIDGDTYYVVDDVQYKAVLHNGEIWYEVIKVNRE